MSKMMTFVMIMAGITLMFYLGGIIDGTINSTLLDMVVSPERSETSPLYLKVLSVSVLVIAVVSTFFARNQNSDFFLMVPIATILFTFGWDFLSIYQSIAADSEVGGIIALLIFGPFMIGYMLSVIEWWRGVAP